MVSPLSKIHRERERERKREAKSTGSGLNGFSKKKISLPEFAKMLHCFTIRKIAATQLSETRANINESYTVPSKSNI